MLNSQDVVKTICFCYLYYFDILQLLHVLYQKETSADDAGYNVVVYTYIYISLS